VVLKVVGATDSAQFERFDGVDHFESLADGEFAFSLRQGTSMSSFLAAAAAHLNICGIRSQEPSLHEIFLRSINNERQQNH
jgi:ABC-type uncharacterized transport system ATPase subunit